MLGDPAGQLDCGVVEDDPTVTTRHRSGAAGVVVRVRSEAMRNRSRVAGNPDGHGHGPGPDQLVGGRDEICAANVGAEHACAE